jgi:NAD(P)-dependent dehydrogenase (short-subunit alcohol dehydrogenase family)
VARVLVTGSTTGLGLAAAQELVALGHEAVFHARNRERAADLPAGATVVIGDLSEPEQVVDLAEQINRLEPLDAVIHNAGVYTTSQRQPNSRDQPAVMAVNLYAPYILTALVAGPSQLIYLSSDMHASGSATVDDLHWTTRRWNGTQAYCDSKLLITTLAFTIARRRPDIRSNAVDPGWVPTRMGGPSAPDDLVLGHRTQVWLAISGDPDAALSGRYWHHQRPLRPAAVTTDDHVQRRLIEHLHETTGIALA